MLGTIFLMQALTAQTSGAPQGGQETAAPVLPSAASSQDPKSPAGTSADPGAQQTGTASPAGTQPSRDNTGVYTIRRTTRLVVLDVVVTDRKGNIATGLTKENFHVTEAKEPQTILNFAAPGADTPPPAAVINSTADLDRLAPRAPVNIILLDEFNTRFEDEAFARYSLKKYLEKQPDKLTVPTQLIAVDLQHFTVLHDYTEDKQAIITALDHHFVAVPWQQRGISWAPERYSTAFETLRRVGQAVMGHPGHKNMIWIGRGFPSINGSLFTLDTETRLNNAVQQCVDVLRDARVTLYTVDPAGISGTSQLSLFEDYQDQVFGGNVQFAKLAVATGGRAFYGRNDVDAEIGTGARDGSNFYTLTYRPTTASLDPQKFRRIAVTIDDRPDLKVTTREGYFVELPPARVNAQNPSRRLAADLFEANSSTMVYDGVPLTLTPSPTDPDSFNILVAARALAWSLATETDPRHAEVILVATSFDKKGKELHRMSKLIRAAAPPDVPPTGRLDRSLTIQTKLEHDPKAVRARFVVRVTASGRIGTADTPLPAPAVVTTTGQSPN